MGKGKTPQRAVFSERADALSGRERAARCKPGERNEATLRRFTAEVWNAGDFSRIYELVTPSYVRHTMLFRTLGVDEFITNVRELHAAFPDHRTVIEEFIHAGDKVVTRWSSRGTHEREYFGVPATGREVAAMGITISRFEEGRIAEEWVSWDARYVLRALGVTRIGMEDP